MVTAVSKQFVIGQLNEDCATQALLESCPNRAAALTRACALAGTNRRVFVGESPNSRTYLLFTCTKDREHP
jgi:hypothetical protein